METRANYIAVGFFTLLAAVVTFGLIYWFGKYGDTDQLVPLDVRIEGSVSGLGPGSVVQFNGINVGRVKGLSLDQADPRYVIVHTEVNEATPVRADTRANIGIRGLSGGAFVQLEGGSPASPSVVSGAGLLSTAPEIQGDPAALSDLLVRINGIATRTEQVMNTLQDFVRTNNDTVTRTFDNAEVFTKALADNSDGVARFMSSAGDVANSLEQLSNKLDGSITRAEAILNAVDPDSVSKSVQNVEAFTQGLADQREQIATLVEAVNKTAQQLDGFSNNLNVTLKKVDGIVSAVDPSSLSVAVKGIEDTSKKASELLAAVDSKELQSTISDAAAAVKKTRSLVDGVDEKALANALNNLTTASNDASKLIAAIDQSKVTAAIDDLSESAKGARTIVADVAKVTGPLGERSQEIETIIADTSKFASGARNLVDGIDQNAVRNLISGLSTTSADVSKLLTAIDASKINTAVENISNAAEGAQTIVSDVSKVTGPLGRRSAEVEAIITDASQLASRLNESSKKIDALIEQAGSMLGGEDGQGLVDDARRTLAEFRRSARNLDAQISSVANSVNSFTRRGLGDTQGLIRDARQSLNRIDRVMRNLESNPSSLITGAGGNRVRESSGRRPRR